jgi:hypothetical protein
MEQGNIMIITKSQIEQAKLVANALQQKQRKKASNGGRFLGKYTGTIPILRQHIVGPSLTHPSTH